MVVILVVAQDCKIIKQADFAKESFFNLALFDLHDLEEVLPWF